ncbi:hypothetical protein EK21DRAFT_56477 [Setomelanomma holmii]|uniref:BHLH domain-containing protein n=1 Tax=Setomelanomma holmii TaxID=210430 RepID=A0A9P4HJ52_9PLEO|nr:hypothetical protein EK21DRAFT_56477 [Setomelanomma holmii]
MNGQAWTNAETFDAMDATTEQSFGDLINFDQLDLDLSEFSYNNGEYHGGPSSLHDFGAQLPQHHPNGTPGARPQANISGHGMPQHNNSFSFDYAMGQYSQAGTPVFTQAPDQVYRPHQGVPPTPNSIEMHGDPHRYMQQMDPQQALFDQRYNMRKDDAIPDFPVPGAYFSPLTSPALNAQSHQHAHQQSQNTTSGSSTGHSPIDVDIDMLGEPAMTQQETGRKLRSTNKRNVPRSGNASGRVRQSPIVKPGRRKATVSSLIPPKEVTELMQEARGGRPSSSGLDVPRSRDASETDSISPEPLLSEMRPPPKPGSVTQSPAMMAQFNGPATPATPASLMRIHPSPNFGGPPEAPPMMEDLTLPEASLDRPALSRLDTVILDGDQDTPRLTARKTPKLNPLSTPGAAMSVADTHALLLASKSNYQNILDGTTVPGVVYPTSLSTNLTSKRTSHKIAEQGRRNRINMALQEMQALLPSPLIGATDAKSPESSAAQSSNSKAAKVESAIDYIKQLKREVSERDKLIEYKDQEMEQLRKELAALRRSSSVGSSADVAAQLKAEPTSSPNTDTEDAT